MFDDGISNEFENAHQKGLRRGFDLGWSYKGRFARHIISDILAALRIEMDELESSTSRKINKSKQELLHLVLYTLKKHQDNREFITSSGI